MIARLWHLVRTEARGHRGVLGLWLLLLVLVATGAMTNIWIQKNLTWPERIRFEGTFPGNLLEWNSQTAYSADPWLWLMAGLLAAWIWLADPLQSPNAFWATRPVRLSELMIARALLCLAALVLLPALLAACTSLSGGFSLRDTFLSAASFGLVKAGLVPVGFLVGIFWPAPGKRCMALLPALGWWLGLICWRVFKEDDSDFTDHSFTFVLLWVVVPLALLALARFRRSILLQGVFAVCAFALVWIAGTLQYHVEEPGWQSAQAAGLPALRISASPEGFEFLPGRSGKQRMAVRLKVKVDGLPPDAAALLAATQVIITPGDAAPRPWLRWSSRTLMVDSWYNALAHAMNVSPQDFPKEWRDKEWMDSVSLPASMFESWKDDQAVTITGKIRLKLLRLREQWRGTYHKSLAEWRGAFRLHGAVSEISSSDGSVRWMRPWMADGLVRVDSSAQGILFNSHLTSWVLAFQPPQKLPDGSFTRDLTRTTPQWAVGEYEGPARYYMATGSNWLRTDTSSTTLYHRHEPEFAEIRRDNSGGLDGLPAALIYATEFAAIELPLEPLTLTKRQILDTWKASPAHP